MNRILSFTVLVIMFLSSCSNKVDYLGSDYRLFKNTEAWELAKAVQEQDTLLISSYSSIVPIDFKEPKFGQTLLMLAVQNGLVNSVEKLLQLGADPEISRFLDGKTTTILAADVNTSSVFIEKVLNYGGNPNSMAKVDTVVSPLIEASGSNLENVRLLIMAGADINYKTNSQQTPLLAALTNKKVEIVSYLLAQPNINIDNVTIYQEDGDSTLAVKWLRYWFFPLDSKEYKEKMEIVEMFIDKGQDYFDTAIPKHLYDSYSDEYLKQY